MKTPQLTETIWFTSQEPNPDLAGLPNPLKDSRTIDARSYSSVLQLFADRLRLLVDAVPSWPDITLDTTEQSLVAHVKWEWAGLHGVPDGMLLAGWSFERKQVRLSLHERHQ